MVPDESEVKATLRGLKPRSHTLLFYDSTEKKREILYEYLADGLESGRGLIYVCSEEKPGDVRKGLAKVIDLEPNERSGNVVIRNYDEWYIENGRADPLKIINRWKEANEAFQRRGLGMRVAGEISCFFTEGKVRDLLRYEYTLHRVLPFKMEAICAYDIRAIVKTGYTEMIMPLVRAHGKAIFTSKNGTTVVEPNRVEEDDVEELLRIRI